MRKPPGQQRTMKKQKISSSTIGIIVTVALTIFPLTQIMLFYLNGGMTYIFAIPFGATTKSEVTTISSLLVNSILTILGLVIFYFARRTWGNNSVGIFNNVFGTNARDVYD